MISHRYSCYNDWKDRIGQVIIYYGEILVAFDEWNVHLLFCVEWIVWVKGNKKYSKKVKKKKEWKKE